MTRSNVPAIFIVDAACGIDKEANGTVYHFCSDECRDKYCAETLDPNGPDLSRETDRFSYGEDAEYPKQTVCCQCGDKLP